MVSFTVKSIYALLAETACPSASPRKAHVITTFLLNFRRYLSETQEKHDWEKQDKDKVFRHKSKTCAPNRGVFDKTFLNVISLSDDKLDKESLLHEEKTVWIPSQFQSFSDKVFRSYSIHFVAF